MYSIHYCFQVKYKAVNANLNDEVFSLTPFFILWKISSNFFVKCKSGNIRYKKYY